MTTKCSLCGKNFTLNRCGKNFERTKLTPRSHEESWCCACKRLRKQANSTWPTEETVLDPDWFLREAIPDRPLERPCVRGEELCLAMKRPENSPFVMREHYEPAVWARIKREGRLPEKGTECYVCKRWRLNMVFARLGSNVFEDCEKERQERLNKGLAAVPVRVQVYLSNDQMLEGCGGTGKSYLMHLLKNGEL